MSLRKASASVRKLVKPYECEVRGRTVSFEGFGFGKSEFVNISCKTELSDSVIQALQQIKSEFNWIIFSLEGKAYPFGYTIKQNQA